MYLTMLQTSCWSCRYGHSWKQSQDFTVPF